MPTAALCSKPADISEFQFRIDSRVDREIFAGVVLKLVINYALRYTALTREVSSAYVDRTGVSPRPNRWTTYPPSNLSPLQ